MIESKKNICIPQIGLGVFKIEPGAEMNDVIKNAYEIGYRLFDTAQMYHNEDALGDAIQNNQIDRNSIFLISKVDNGNQGYENTISSFYDSLSKLKTDYLDAFLIHWPGLDKNRTLKTWRALEDLYKQNKVKAIGVCNFEKEQLQYLLSHCTIAPMINQIEHTPLMHDEDLISFCKENDIKVMAWGPLLRGNMENQKIKEIAKKHEKSPAQILLRWNIQQNIIPIPKSKNPVRLKENFSVFDFTLEDKEMQILNSMNENHRTSHDPLTFDF